jgi:hypothetical protein
MSPSTPLPLPVDVPVAGDEHAPTVVAKLDGFVVLVDRFGASQLLAASFPRRARRRRASRLRHLRPRVRASSRSHRRYRRRSLPSASQHQPATSPAEYLAPRQLTPPRAAPVVSVPTPRWAGIGRVAGGRRAGGANSTGQESREWGTRHEKSGGPGTPNGGHEKSGGPGRGSSDHSGNVGLGRGERLPKKRSSSSPQYATCGDQRLLRRQQSGRTVWRRSVRLGGGTAPSRTQDRSGLERLHSGSAGRRAVPGHAHQATWRSHTARRQYSVSGDDP